MKTLTKKLLALAALISVQASVQAFTWNFTNESRQIITFEVQLGNQTQKIQEFYPATIKNMNFTTPAPTQVGTMTVPSNCHPTVLIQPGRGSIQQAQLKVFGSICKDTKFTVTYQNGTFYINQQL